MKIIKYCLLLTMLTIFPAKVSALDVELTPSHVYSLWININQAVLASAELTPGDTRLIDQTRAMKQGVFSGKVPGDVYTLALKVESRFDILRVESGLSPTRPLDVGDENTTPSDVFLGSSRILIASVEWIIGETGPEHLISGYFAKNKVSGKTPSDVYGLVDLAYRRLSLITKDFSDNNKSEAESAQ